MLMNDIELSPHALAALRMIKSKPAPSQEFNSGVTQKLLRERLATSIFAPTPYKTRKGNIGHLQITPDGLQYLAMLNINETCPFCHSKRLQVTRGWNSYVPAQPRCVVLCMDCEAMGPEHETEEGAIALWNKRGKA